MISWTRASRAHQRVADLFCQIRSGTDIAFLGGVIRYAVENNRIAKDYLINFTNARSSSKAISRCRGIRTACFRP